MRDLGKNHAPIRIAIFRTSSLGDVILSSACLNYLHTLPYSFEIYWIGRGISLEALKQSWPQIKPIEWKKRANKGDLSKTIELLKNCHLFVDLQNNIGSNLIGNRLKRLYKIPYFASFKTQILRNKLIFNARIRGRRKPLPREMISVNRLQFRLMVDALKRGLKNILPNQEWINIDHEDYRPELNIPLTFNPPWRKELRYGLWIAVAPGAAHATKETPSEIFADTLFEIQKLISSGGYSIDITKYFPSLVFLGDEKDREKARLLMDLIQWKGQTLNLCGMLSLWETAAALSEVTCLLSNDSSLSHLAEAVNTPTVVFFGPTVESFGFAPRLDKSKAFSALIGCRPCSKHGKKPCRFNDKLCFRTINYPKAAMHMIELLASTNINLNSNVSTETENSVTSSVHLPER